MKKLTLKSSDKTITNRISDLAAQSYAYLKAIKKNKKARKRSDKGYWHGLEFRGTPIVDDGDDYKKLSVMSDIDKLTILGESRVIDPISEIKEKVKILKKAGIKYED